MKEVMEKNEIDPFYAGLYGGFYDEENDAVSFPMYIVCVDFRHRVTFLRFSEGWWVLQCLV